MINSSKIICATLMFLMSSVLSSCGDGEPEYYKHIKNDNALPYDNDTTNSKETDEMYDELYSDNKVMLDAASKSLLKKLWDKVNGNDDDDTDDDDVIDDDTVTPPDYKPEDCYKGDKMICAIEAAIIRLTNAKRPLSTPLKGDKNLSYVARDWSQRQANRGRLSHLGFVTGRRALVYKTEFKTSIPYNLNSENVAYTSTKDLNEYEKIAEALVEQWWGSAGHKEAMLGDHDVIGVGVAIKNAKVYATQIFGSDKK